MTKKSTSKKSWIFPLFIVTGVVLFFVDLYIGSVRIPFSDISTMLLGGSATKESWEIILFDSRLPKAIAAVLCGIALSISGLKMQTLFRNPLAGPYLLGISSGAGLGVAIFIMGLSFLGISSSGLFIDGQMGIVVAAVIGAMLVMMILLLVIQRLKDMMTVLIVGIMIGSVITALIGVIQFFSNDYQLKSFVLWMMGDLNAVTMTQIKVLTPVVIISVVGAFFLSKPLNTMLLGDNQAKSLGTNLYRSRILVVVFTSVLAGAVTAFCGPIGFIGIIVPHLARMVSRTFNHQILIPVSALIGANILLVADIISQLPGMDERLPINSITALIGIPIILWIIFNNKKITQLN